MNVYDQFYQYFTEENKEMAVTYILDQLERGEVDVVTLYEKILAPMLNHLTCELEDKRICIWKEHVKTAIVRTIVECCYPYVLAMKKELNLPARGVAAILCPPDEYHDLGARMVADFFTICGYQAIYVGSNTPYKDFYNAVHVIRPEIAAISVSNYYNLFVTKKMIEELKAAVGDQLTIIVGGYAFEDAPEKYKLVGADCYTRSFDDIRRLAEGGVGA